MCEVKITRLKKEHLDDICKLEKECFSLPWSREMFVGEIEKECAHYFAAEDYNGRAVAYGGFFCVYEDAEITNIAVLPEMQNRHIATDVLKEIIHEAKSLGCRKITLEVRVSNEKAQKLYDKFGFETVSIRKRYYRDNNEDALLMLKTLD